MSDGQQFKLSLPEALKLSTILLGIIAITVGHHAHYGCPITTPATPPDFQETCNEDGFCPSGFIEMEKSFMGIVTIFLILSVIFFILGALMDFSDGVMKIVDIVFHFVAALLVIIAGILMLISSAQLYSFIKDQQVVDNAHTIKTRHFHKQSDVLEIECFTSSPEKYGSKGMPELLKDKEFRDCIAETTLKKEEKEPSEEDTHSIRLARVKEHIMYHEKNAAGVMAILAGIVYILVGVFTIIKDCECCGKIFECCKSVCSCCSGGCCSGGCGECCKCGGGGGGGGGSKGSSDSKPKDSSGKKDGAGKGDAAEKPKEPPPKPAEPSA